MTGHYNQSLSPVTPTGLICQSFDRQHPRLGTWWQCEGKKSLKLTRRPQAEFHTGGKARKNEGEKGNKDRSVGEFEKNKMFSILSWAEELHSGEGERSAEEQLQ